MSAADAGALFDQLDTDKSGTLSKEKAGFFKRAWSGFRSKKSSSLEGSTDTSNYPFVPLYTDVGDLNETKSAEVVSKERENLTCSFRRRASHVGVFVFGDGFASTTEYCIDTNLRALKLSPCTVHLGVGRDASVLHA